MKRFFLLLGDVATLYLALFLTLLVRYGHGFEYSKNLGLHLNSFTFIFAVWILVFYIANLYEIWLAKNRLEFFSTLLYSIGINTLISIVLFYLVPFLKITPKTNLAIFTGATLVLITGWRYLFNKLIVRGGEKNNTLIIGAGRQSEDLYDFLLANPQLGYNALGVINVEDTTAAEILEDLIKQKNVRTLVLSPTAYKISQIIDILYRLLPLKIIFHNLSDFYERTTGKVPLGAIDQAWFLENLTEGSKRGYEIAKRAFDLILAFTIGLVALFLLPIISLAIKRDSEGPVFLSQRRIGQAGKVFTLIKFRTMTQDAEKTGPIWASENDSRTTRVGRIIRRIRLDELPQVWNVIRGEMSFVGPRPERPEFHDKLKKGIPFYEERYLIKPGLTGWAQIKYKLDFGGGMTVQDTAEKLQYDLFYIKNRSLMFDLGIILKTINIVLKKVLG